MLHPDRYFRHLVAVSAAPDHLWKELAERMVDEDWTVEQAKKEVQKVKPKPQPKEKPPIRYAASSGHLSAAQSASVTGSGGGAGHVARCA